MKMKNKDSQIKSWEACKISSEGIRRNVLPRSLACSSSSLCQIVKNKIKTTSVPRPAMQLNNRAKYYYRYARSRKKKKTNKTCSKLSRSFRLLFSVSHVEPLIRQVWTCVSAGPPTKLVAAAAVARSGFPLRLLAETRGKAEPGVVAVFVPRLAGVDGGNPLTVE